MIVPPVIVRELRVALRRHQATKSRFRMGLFAAIGVSILLFIGALSDSSFWGTELHHALFFFGLYLAIYPVMQVSVGLFCEERRNQTLELLYLTGMGPGELFAGKLLGGLLIASGDLLALMPFLAIPFLSGGLSLDLYWATIACFPVLLAFTVAMGVLASVLSRDEGVALLGAALLGAAICLATPLPYYLGLTVSGKPPFSDRWLCLSPAYGPYLVERNFAGARPGTFWLTAGLTLAWALAGLALAAVLLRHTWRQEIARTGPWGWGEKWRTFIYGSASWRGKLRQRLLPANPFQWLVEQDRKPVVLAWALIAGVVLFWLLGWAAWPRAWPSPMNLYLTAAIVALGTGGVAKYAAARQMAFERRDGSFELLLTTPLRPAEIVNGEAAAIRAQFRPVRWVLAGLCLVMMLGGFLTRNWTVRAVVSYVFIWSFLVGWCLYSTRESAFQAMWVALNTGRPVSALFSQQRGGWWWISMFINGRNFYGGLLRARDFPSGTVTELVVVSILMGVALLILAVAKLHPYESRDLLITEMRAIAREPVPDPRDPRLRKWNGRGRLYLELRRPNWDVLTLPEEFQTSKKR